MKMQIVVEDENNFLLKNIVLARLQFSCNIQKAE